MRNLTQHGGDLIASVFVKWSVPAVYTLCGGHISPILVGAKNRGIKIVDCRDEQSAVFAADALARLTGLPGVVAVTAGPGVTNSITALKNAQMAQSPLVLLGGATATVLRGRGALQDIDQMALIHSAVKWAARCDTVGKLVPTLERALRRAIDGVPGPVFLEVPVDVLYPEKIVREWYLKEAGVENASTLSQKAIGVYLKAHLYRQFHAPSVDVVNALPRVRLPRSRAGAVSAAARMLESAERPALVVGSQTMANCRDPEPLARAVSGLGIPTWLGSTARGLLGRQSAIQFRHERAKALREADVVVTCGFPFDFRLKYGLAIGRQAKVIAVNLSSEELVKNRKPELAIRMAPADFLLRLAERMRPSPRWRAFVEVCQARESARDAEIQSKARQGGPLVDPLHLFLRLEEKLADDSVLVVDGGDFVATAAYVLRPRRPLSWLDPGVFGTLGVGGGFALGAAIARPGSEIWVIYGDGSCAYSLAEFDTYVRHGMAPIALIGTDASWRQIARDQVSLLGSDVGTTLLRTAYHEVAAGYGGVGLLLDDPARVDATLDEAKALAKKGRPVCINVQLAKSDFREGSISI